MHVDSKMQGHKVGSSEDEDTSKTVSEDGKAREAKKESLLTKKESKKFKNKKVDKKVSGPERPDSTKFEGEGITFKAKLIGLDDVDEARGDQLCQDTLHRMKAAVKNSGTHKTRISLSVSLDGIKIKDERTGDILYHHPVHKISFISQDISDSRAFGYIFSLSQTGHQFVGIKTEKMAAHVVIALRDLFQAVLELKKREIVKAETEQQKDGNYQVDETDSVPQSEFTEPIYSEVPERHESICDLLDLRTELDQLQEGIAQMNNSIAAHAYQQILAPQKVEIHKEKIEEEEAPPVPERVFSMPEDKYAVFAEIDAVPSLFDNPAIVQPQVMQNFDPETTMPQAFNDSTETEEFPSSNSPKPADFSIFEDLDPLGKGRPFISKEDFFRNLKTPPKKTLKDFPGGDGFDGPSETSNHGVSLFDEPRSAPPLPFNPFGSPPPRIPPRSPPLVDPFASTDNWANDPFCDNKPQCTPPPPLISRSSEPNFPVIPSPPPRPSPRKCATPSPLRPGSVRPLPASPLAFRKLPSDERSSSENHFTFDESHYAFSADRAQLFAKNESASPNPFSPKRGAPVLQSVVSKSVSVLSDVSLARAPSNGMDIGSMSPEERSIFRKTQDPFADDFFLSLAKSSNSSGTDLCKNQQVKESICERT